MHGLQVVDPLFGDDQAVGECLRRLVVLACLDRVSPGGGVVGHRQGLARGAADPFQFLHGAVELELGLLLVGYHAGGLLDQATVLLLRLCHSLFQLHLRVGGLLEAAGQLGGQVLPPATYDFPHARHDTSTREARCWPGSGQR